MKTQFIRITIYCAEFRSMTERVCAANASVPVHVLYDSVSLISAPSSDLQFHLTIDKSRKKHVNAYCAPLEISSTYRRTPCLKDS